MLNHELKKLFLKNKVLFFLPVLIAFEIAIVLSNYDKTAFSSEFSHTKYNEYMDEFAGKLTDENENKILAEQAKIIDAQNEEIYVRSKMESDFYKSRAEYEADLEPTKAVTALAEPFDELFTRYSHALKNREKNYIIRGDYNCMTHDFTDFPLVFLIIFGVAALFLNEEYSRVVTPIKISVNGRGKTLRAKLTALLFLILFGAAFRGVLEFAALLNCGDIRDFNYPIQSVVYFENSTLNVSIIGGFFTIQALRFLGYLFIAALTILLSVTVRKGIAAVFVPFAWVILQQFVFYPSTPAYCMPTGLLRATGYLRGKYKRDEFDPKTTLDGVDDNMMRIIVIVSLILFFITIFIAAKYYGAKFKFPKKAIMLIAVMSLCGAACGCSEKEEKIDFNLSGRQEFDEYYFEKEDGAIIRISAIDNSERKIAQNPFSDGRYSFSVCGGCLYYCDNSFDINEFAVYQVDLNTLKQKKIYSEALNSYVSFMGIDFYRKPHIIKERTPFSDGKNLFFYSEDGIERVVNGKPRIIVSEKIFQDKLSFDGERLYYINNDRKLICFDLRDNSRQIVCDEFARCVYCGQGRVLYSTQEGVFSLNNDLFAEKLSDDAADEIDFSKDNINVFAG